MTREPSVPFEFPEDEAYIDLLPDGRAIVHLPDRNVWKELVTAAFPFIAEGRTPKACLTRLAAVAKLIHSLGINCPNLPLDVSRQAVSSAKQEFIQKLKVAPPCLGKHPAKVDVGH